MSNLSEVKWGFIGCGEVTEKKSGPAFSIVPGSKVVAVMSRDLSKAQDYANRHSINKFYNDPISLINDPDVNAVYIATPPSSHSTFALMAMRVGKPVYVENDANVAAYGEALAGAAAGIDDVVVITLGTGVGGGIIIDGKIYTGFNQFGGELGHAVVEYNGWPCTCGRKGCMEAYSSATGLIKMTRIAMAENPKSKLWEVAPTMQDVNGKTAFDAMRMGDEAGTAVVDKYIKYLACGLANYVNIFQPEVLLIGGGICKEGETLLAPLRELIAKEAYSIEGQPFCDLRVCKLGNDAGTIGAAMLWKQH